MGGAVEEWQSVMEQDPPVLYLLKPRCLQTL